MTTRFISALLALLTFCLVSGGALASAGGASAHAALVSADPADGAVLDRSPVTVTATFNEDMQPQFAAMTVVGPDANLWSTGDPQVEGTHASIDVRPLGPAGRYTVNYRVTSADGHVVTGAWSFELKVASTGTPGPAVAAPPAASESGTPESGSDIPMWPFAVAAVAAVAAAAGWAVRRRR